MGYMAGPAAVRVPGEHLGTARMTLHELAIPFSIDLTTALLTDRIHSEVVGVDDATHGRQTGIPIVRWRATTNPRSDTQPRLHERTLCARPFLNLVTRKRHYPRMDSVDDVFRSNEKLPLHLSRRSNPVPCAQDDDGTVQVVEGFGAHPGGYVIQPAASKVRV